MPPVLGPVRRDLRREASMISRRPLREKVHEELLQRIYQGTLGPGTRLSDVTLAAELTVSRTPVRETLLRLAREGVVEAELGRGFLVRPLSAEQVRDAYPILWTLECLALRLSPRPSAARLAALDRLNGRLGAARQRPERLIEVDDRWHSLLLTGCANDQLLGLIRSVKESLRRYEYAYMRDRGRVSVSTEQHARITRALAAGNVESAVRWLERNWRFSMEELLAWLEGTVPGAGGS